ncbi:TRPV3-like protein [Mya arenaria]|uniref:TRPV3-like protein n=1 Tax=Mya arenaria TaxID=6604 RepID=A0ABY7E6C3_MYAAR|nr:TRPV3-like protein [Mya arenaria]
MKSNEDKVTVQPEDTVKEVLDKIINQVKEIYNLHVKGRDISRKRVKSVVSLLDKLNIDDNGLVGIVNETSTKSEYTNIIYIAIENYVPQLETFLESLIERYPKLICLPRKDEKYYGHTAFHMAVCKNYQKLAKKMLDTIGRVDKEELFRECATGRNFKQTVMIGELPLFTAALSFNIEMFEILLNKGADLYETNSTKDDIYHALIRYAHYYPNKEDEVIEFLRLIMAKVERTRNADVGENADTFDDSSKGSKSTDTTKLGHDQTKDTSKELKHADKTKQEDQNNEPSQEPMTATSNKQEEHPTKESSNKLEHANSIKQDKYPKKDTSPGELWSWRNNSGLNPLELATKYGLCKIFGMIYNSEGNDGLNDIKTYDITELDPVLQSTARDHPADSGSLLQFLFEIHPSQAFPFIRTPQISKIIHKKWKYYRIIVYIWFILHLVFMGFLTWYAIKRSKQNANDEEENRSITVRVFAFIALIWGIIYALPEIVKVIIHGVPCKRKGIRSKLAIGKELDRSVQKRTNQIKVCDEKESDRRVSISYSNCIRKYLRTIWKWAKTAKPNPYSCESYRWLMTLFSISLILDIALLMHSDLEYEQYCLYISMIFGWLFVIFFLRVFKYFSFFGVFLQQVIFGDVIRFIFIFLLIILGFGTAMYMAVQGSSSTEDDGYSTFGKTLISMITLIAGLGDPPSFYDTRRPGICVAIFILYILMATVVILNALIAMMGTTCSELVGNVGNKHTHDRHWTFERLSVILFFESIFPEKWIKRVGKEVKTNRETRRHLEIRSLKDLDSKEIVDERANIHTTKDLPRAQNNKNATMDIYHINQFSVHV